MDDKDVAALVLQSNAALAERDGARAERDAVLAQLAERELAPEPVAAITTPVEDDPRIIAYSLALQRIALGRSAPPAVARRVAADALGIDPR